MTDPMSKHFKDLDNRVLQVFKHVVHLHLCAEGHPVIIYLAILSQETFPPRTAACAARIPPKKLFRKAGDRRATHLETVGVSNLWKIRKGKCPVPSGIYETHCQPSCFVFLGIRKLTG